MELLAETDARRAAAGKARFRFGVALHVGDVLYGNIGTGNRLDFTVIGPAVNLAARIGGLCDRLDRPILLSADFAAQYGAPLASLGKHELKGVAQAQEVFGLPG